MAGKVEKPSEPILKDHIEELRQSIEGRRNDRSPEARLADRYEITLLSKAYLERSNAALDEIRQRVVDRLDQIDQRRQQVVDQIEQANQRIAEADKTITQDVRAKLSQTARDQYDSRKEVRRG